MTTLRPRAKCIIPKNLDKILEGLFPRHDDLTYNGYNVDYIEQLTEQELLTAAKKLKTGKSPGPDGIPAEAIQTVAMANPAALTKVMDNILQTGNFPTQ